MNDNKIDHAFLITLLVISRHFTVFYMITLIDKVPRSKCSGSDLFYC